MAVLYHIWVPAVAVAHALGIALMLYSLEKVSGIVSKSWRRLRSSTSGQPRRQGSSRKTTAANGVDVEQLGCDPVKPVAEGQLVQLGAWPADPKLVDFPFEDRHAVHPSLCIDMDIVASHQQQCEPRPMDLSWHGVACSVVNSSTLEHKQVLKPCSGKAVPGQVVAFLGPSGAGKSTLLDILADRKTSGKLQGQVLMNGKPRDMLFARASAYVPQEEVFVPTMTALETVLFHATLSLPSSVAKGDRNSRIDRVLSIMGLIRVKNTTVGGALPGGILVRGLSGGEKRRLAIACALVASPSILFLDEPTTGLDSYAALSVMEHMSALAKLGHTIITTIHQPRAAIWAKFHKVVVLSEGYQLYSGEAEGAQPWFTNRLGYPYNAQLDGAVSDWLMDLVSIGFAKSEAHHRRTMSKVEDVANAAKAFAAADESQAAPDFLLSPRSTALSRCGESNVDSDTRSVICGGSEVSCDERHASGMYAASWWTQFRVLLKRALLAQLRNPTDASCRLLMSCWVGILAGFVFFNLGMENTYVSERLALLFFVLLLYELLPFCYMSFYVADRRFFAADIANGLYHPFAYYIAAIVAGVPFVLLNTVVGSMAAYGLAGMRDQARALFLNMLLTSLQSLISTQLQIFCVWLTPNQDLAYVLATAYVATSILLSGFYIRIEDMRVSVMRGLSYLSYTKYAMQGVSRLELLSRHFDSSACPSSAENLAALGPAQAPGISPGITAQPIPGGANLACQTSGESLLDYWGYGLTVAEVAVILLAFYLIFHVASYLALSRLYRQRR